MTNRIEDIHERLTLANGIQLDEVVARHYREAVPWLLAEVERYKDAFVRANEAVTAREIEIERLNAALAPVAPDAEPTEWEWSLDDVVQGDGHVWHRVGDGTHPWASRTGSDQRDQDITELVTKHGGRVLVCKARGIGVGGAR